MSQPLEGKQLEKRHGEEVLALAEVTKLISLFLPKAFRSQQTTLFLY
jgi:hypothetical protein